MDIERAVEEFVANGKDLFRRLRSEGDSLSDLGRHILRTQLHILSVEADHVHSKRLPAKKTTSGEFETCAHGRAIDNYLDENGNRTKLYYCLECGGVIEAPSTRSDAVAGNQGN